jgi:hypothetical protein
MAAFTYLHPLAASPFALLDAHSSLRLVTDAVHEDDALCLALTCRTLRDALWARFPARAQPLRIGDAHASIKRLHTRQVALVATVARLIWARGMDAAEDAMHAACSEQAGRRMLEEARHAPRLDDYDACRLAARHGALATLQWAYNDPHLCYEDKPISLYDTLVDEAGAGGHLEVVQWLWTLDANDSLERERVLQMTSITMEAAAGGPRPADEDGPRTAGDDGHLEVLQWLRATMSDAEWGRTPERDRMCSAAVDSGSFAALQWLRANGCPWGVATIERAAEGGHLEMLQWARANGCPWATWGSEDEGSEDDGEDTGQECLAAAEGGHLAVLQWLRANGRSWAHGPDICNAAARGGHLAVLQYAHANGCGFTGGTCLRAVDGGYLAVLQWLRANGCDWDKRTCAYAVSGGHLEVLQWARANGCPWNKAECLDYAVRNRGETVSPPPFLTEVEHKKWMADMEAQQLIFGDPAAMLKWIKDQAEDA